MSVTSLLLFWIALAVVFPISIMHCQILDWTNFCILELADAMPNVPFSHSTQSPILAENVPSQLHCSLHTWPSTYAHCTSIALLLVGFLTTRYSSHSLCLTDLGTFKSALQLGYYAHSSILAGQGYNVTVAKKCNIWHPSSVICHPSSVICHLSSIIRHPSSVIRHLSSVIRHPSSVIRHLSSVICHPSSRF